MEFDEQKDDINLDIGKKINPKLSMFLIGLFLGAMLSGAYFTFKISNSSMKERFEKEMSDFKNDAFLHRRGITENISVKSGIYIYYNHTLAQAMILGKLAYICTGAGTQ